MSDEPTSEQIAVAAAQGMAGRLRETNEQLIASYKHGDDRYHVLHYSISDLADAADSRTLADALYGLIDAVHRLSPEEAAEFASGRRKRKWKFPPSLLRR